MNKEVARLINDFKDEIRNEWKQTKEALEGGIRSEERNLRAEIDEMKRSMDFFSKTLDDTNEKLVATLAENNALKKENCVLQHKVSSLEKKLADCQSGLLQSEQYSRNRNLEIKGVTEKPNENLVEVLQKIGEVVGETVTAEDIDVCHRVRTKQAGQTNIIVQFQRRDKRDQLLQKSRKKRLTNPSLGLPTESPVFVNEHLCPEVKKMLGMAIARKREHSWKFVWTKNGTIHARRTETSPVVRIMRESDLNKITNT
ncbi:hypothetical protein HPB50_013971 [Hyalomma asiaticum]|uniref:Uncharacterized protein n=1 Tax=Hyalomma asiaticum TaxID=266040 RepID=A0ACB7TK18_HYAAI|nr:hypothetical protein HPB50_013971 [Hyalomma asiaticum]